MKFQIGDLVQIEIGNDICIGEIMEVDKQGDCRVKYGLGFETWENKRYLKMSYYKDFLEKIKDRIK